MVEKMLSMKWDGTNFPLA